MVSYSHCDGATVRSASDSHVSYISIVSNGETVAATYGHSSQYIRFGTTTRQSI